jgi:hypothetical protein
MLRFHYIRIRMRGSYLTSELSNFEKPYFDALKNTRLSFCISSKIILSLGLILASLAFGILIAQNFNSYLFLATLRFKTFIECSPPALRQIAHNPLLCTHSTSFIKQLYHSLFSSSLLSTTAIVSGPVPSNVTGTLRRFSIFSTKAFASLESSL